MYQANGNQRDDGHRMHWLSSLPNHFYACNVSSENKTWCFFFHQKSRRWALKSGEHIVMYQRNEFAGIAQGSYVKFLPFFTRGTCVMGRFPRVQETGLPGFNSSYRSRQSAKPRVWGFSKRKNQMTSRAFDSRIDSRPQPHAQVKNCVRSAEKKKRFFLKIPRPKVFIRALAGSIILVSCLVYHYATTVG